MTFSDSDFNSDSDRGALDTLARYRPDPATLTDEWTTGHREAALAAILSTTHDERPRWIARHRRATGLAAVAACAAAAVVAAGVVLPDGSPGGPNPAAAAALGRLATEAGTQGGDVGPGQYAYVREQQAQTAEPGEDPQPGSTVAGGFSREELATWTARDGSVVSYRGIGTSTGCVGRPDPYVGDPTKGDYAELDSAGLAVLPTDPAGLARFLDAHPSGDNRGGRNRFLAVGDLLRSGLAPAQLRAAALRVLARTDGVVVHSGRRDALGRPAIRVDRRDGDATTDSLFLSPTTSRMLEELTSQPDFVYRNLVRRSTVVDTIPDDLPRCS